MMASELLHEIKQRLAGIGETYRRALVGPGVIEAGPAKGLRFDAGADTVRFVKGDYEQPVQQALASLARPGDVCYDIGANLGFFSILLGRLVGPTGVVHAFEPVPANADLVARNAARHLEGYLAGKPADYRPLVYCWRGGQRSGSIALILAQIGWRVGVLDGGWRSWRRLVQTALYEAPFPAPVLVLDGNTGTAKTAILHKVAALGGQVLDLEGMARHRGSLFGLAPGDTQPAQKGFESALALAVARLDPTRAVLVEAESNRIGTIRVP